LCLLLILRLGTARIVIDKTGSLANIKRHDRSEKALCNIKFSTSKNTSLLASLLVGLVTLSIGFYLLITEIVFIQKAARFDATIVEVRHELVQKGKGSVLAYVPVVELSDATHGIARIRVDTFNEQSVYQVGRQMKVLCDSSSLKCVPNTFIDTWGNSAGVLLLSLIFLSMPLLYHPGIRAFLKLRT